MDPARKREDACLLPVWCSVVYLFDAIFVVSVHMILIYCRETMSVCGKEWRRIIAKLLSNSRHCIWSSGQDADATIQKKIKRHTLLVLVRPELYRLDSQYKFGVISRFGSIHLYFTEDGVKWLVTCVLSRLANAVLFLWAFLTLVSKILLHTYSQSCTLYNVIPPTTARSGDTVGFRKLSADSPRVCSFVDAVLLRLLMHY